MFTLEEDLIVMSNMIRKEDLVELGFCSNQAITIIRQAKLEMVNQGYPYYNNKRLGVVPRHVVETIIGTPLPNEVE